MTKKAKELLEGAAAASESKAVAVVQKSAHPLVAKAEAIEIKDAKGMEAAAEVLSQLNKVGDAAEDEKQKVLKPLNAARTAELKRWKPLETVIGDAIALVRGKMSKYQTEAKKAADAEAESIAGRVGEGKGHLKVETAVRKIEEIDTPAAVVNAESGLVKFRTDKKLKITDGNAIKAYITKTGDWSFAAINESKLLEALKGGLVVPGAEIEEVQVPVNMR